MEALEFDLEFEKPLMELAKKIRLMQKEKGEPGNPTKLQEAREELSSRLQEIYANLSTWETVQVARHKARPHAADYIHLIFDDFMELHGDRAFGDDAALIGGLATFNAETVIVLGHQKGRGPKEQQLHNFGMPHPEGYRKAYRLMQMAGKFKFPLICFIDTPGAFPGLADEERGQAEAIAANLTLMARLPVPIIAVVIGEGGSGGALGISVADRLLMLSYSIYTVASPEAAASILWRETSFAPQAAEAMRISAREIIATGIIDGLVPEPVGGAHRNPVLTASFLKTALKEHMADIKKYSIEELLEMRYQKFRSIGNFQRHNSAQQKGTILNFERHFVASTGREDT
ncbi:acetyl-CoA carboxylase carboxyltransferase subunit alpha [Ktedonospora formicarum]|uniref:Acetyl-coenzyme A carboxylase carboxyl transferase subunit alpha n=1 Tax=Ktedonospora formicarum TaxID=2778364 RepID=A0A8J3IAZ5_9CHLR|nr:acetyl-CoA carboxylase carboxyltransferase subunit alpha [Ktedonospora formicarum]GHO48009.1 acetyl-coenzyme A carboxylase carboxyl transferase subunit alpha [Ktedonospora formicarum]